MANSIAKLPTHRNQIKEVRHGTGHTQLLVNAAYQFDDLDHLFDIDYLTQRNLATPIDSGRGTAWYVNAVPHAWVLRQFHRGGAVRRILGDKYFFRGGNHTRSFCEFRLLSYLWNQGLPVPEPIAARFERNGIVYRAHLLTRRIPHALNWSNQLLNQSMQRQPWRKVGTTIAMFHHFGACHVDLNAHNILIDEKKSDIYLIDFDKGTLKSAGSEKWRMGNLARLHRSIVKIVDDASQSEPIADGWRQLVESYTEHFSHYGKPASAQ